MDEQQQYKSTAVGRSSPRQSRDSRKHNELCMSSSTVFRKHTELSMSWSIAFSNPQCICLEINRSTVARVVRNMRQICMFPNATTEDGSKTNNRSVSNPRPSAPTSQTKVSGNQSRYDLYRTSRPSFVFCKLFCCRVKSRPRNTPPPP